MNDKIEKNFFVHLVSDATGNTLQGIARACIAQFDNVHAIERFWPLVRTKSQLLRIIEDIKLHPGPVLFTLVDSELRRFLKKECGKMDIPCMPVLDPLIKGMSAYLGKEPKGIPGLQHQLNDAYFERIDAVDFALSFDDGQSIDGIEEADVVLVGVSRTSKTPTCIYLARRGIKAANIPLVPNVPFPEEVLKYKHPLFIGLVEKPERLAQIRRNRIKNDTNEAHLRGNDYLQVERIEDEVKKSRRLFSQNNWPVIDVTKRSVEETSAEIIVLLQRHKEELGEVEDVLL